MAEKVSIVIPNLQKPKMLGMNWDVYNLVIAGNRAIFAHLTQNMISKAIEESRKKSKEEKKGFFAAWGDQITAGTKYYEKYFGMNPDDILKEDPSNFALEISSVQSVKVHDRSDDDKSYYDIEFNTASGKFKFRYNSNPKDALQKAFPGKVK